MFSSSQVSNSLRETLDAAFGPDGLGLLCLTGDQAQLRVLGLRAEGLRG